LRQPKACAPEGIFRGDVVLYRHARRALRECSAGKAKRKKYGQDGTHLKPRSHRRLQR
jgi:hypothetical protein